MMLFNVNNLPTDVRMGYDNKQKGCLILGLTVKTPYSTGHFWHMEGLDKLILADGTVFVKVAVPNKKALFKATMSCDNDTHAGVRSVP